MTLLKDFGGHVRRVLGMARADAVLMLGPSSPVLAAVIESAPWTTARTAAVLHNGPHDNAATIPQFELATEISLFCLSEAQRISFGALAARMEVICDGIPVGAVPFCDDPAKQRAGFAADPVLANLHLRAARPLVGQIDYFHRNKGMLTTLRMYRDADLARTHDLLLAGGEGWQLPSRRGQHSENSYLKSMQAFITKSGLGLSTHIVGSLTGAQVSRLYGAMDLVLSPVRLEDPPEHRDAESYGQGRANANSAGTPVLMSTAYDASLSARLDLRFGDVAQGAEMLRNFATSTDLRYEVRAFAEKRDSMLPGLMRYSEFVGLLPSASDLAAAIAIVEREEAI